MRVLANIRRLGIALACLLATAFAAVGGAHHIPTEAHLRIEAWLLAGGSADDLCGHQDMAAQGCPVCHLVAAAVLPGPLTVPLPALRVHAPASLPAQIPWHAPPLRDPTLYLRGPPPLT